MKTVILAAGYGTRLKPLTDDTPKALIPIIGEETIIDLLWDKISEISSEIFLISNDKFFEKFNIWRQNGNLNIKIFNDGTRNNDERLGAIGDLELLLDSEHINDDLMVVGSDNVFDWELRDFTEFSKARGTITIGLYDVGKLERAKNLGVVRIDDQNRVVELQEKPQHPSSSLIGVCIYFFPQAKLGLLKEYASKAKEHLRDAPGYFFSWVYQREKVSGYKFEGKWFDIGNFKALEEARKYFAAPER